MHFQRCSSSLYWNQEKLTCDRKRPVKFLVPTVKTNLITSKNGHNENEKSKEEKLVITNTLGIDLKE